MSRDSNCIKQIRIGEGGWRASISRTAPFYGSNSRAPILDRLTSGDAIQNSLPLSPNPRFSPAFRAPLKTPSQYCSNLPWESFRPGRPAKTLVMSLYGYLSSILHQIMITIIR